MILDLSVAAHALDAGLNMISTKFTEITSMGDDDGIKYYKEHFDQIGKQSQSFGPKRPLTFSGGWWEDDVRKKCKIPAASKLPNRASPVGDSLSKEPSQKKDKV